MCTRIKEQFLNNLKMSFSKSFLASIDAISRRRENVTNLLLSQLAGFGFTQNFIWCSFPEYIYDPLEIRVFLSRS